MRSIDHLVLPVTTLALARSQLTGLGFTVAPDARHPFGTGNCCVLFKNRTYLEPITILDRGVADMAAAEGSFFVKRVKRFTERIGEGFAMFALKSADAEADHRAFEQAGMSAGDVFRFSRPASLPDGSEAEMGVLLAYLDDKNAPDAAFFTCQHLAPDVLFQPTFLDHANGAEGVASVAVVAEQPTQFHRLLATALGVELSAFQEGAGLGDRPVRVLSPAGFRAEYGLEAPNPREGLRLAAFEVVVADLDRAIGYAGPTARRHEELIVVPPAPGLGAVVAFRGRGNG